MKTLWLFLFVFLMPVAATAAHEKPFSEKQRAQQQRMKDCNAEAKENRLKGDGLRAFIKTCLSGGQVTVEPATTAAPENRSQPQP